MTRWLVGMDLRATSAGALRYSAWLHAHGGEGVELQALHVIEQLDQHYAIKLGLHPRGRLISLTREATRDVLRQAGIEGCFEEVDVLPGGAADEVLDEQLLARGAAGLVVGRQGPLREGFPPRLGRVARHLLRHAGGPVIVVPPDLEEAKLEGPIVLATDAGPSSVAAGRFAAERAREWQRPLRVVHVVSPMDTGGLSFLPRPAEEGARQARFQAQRAEVERWAEELGLAEGLELELDVRAGSAIDELLAISRLGSPLVVCGARRLSWLERHLKASHATTLSSHAPVPVAVVPPEADAPESNR
ncbi:MAG: universal stress protein [Myxococcales bacterium]|nr:universal stress protein [Myxococcales bacterium]MCB9714099.1 universal stress protein [Myxococcales bacterium]